MRNLLIEKLVKMAAESEDPLELGKSLVTLALTDVGASSSIRTHFLEKVRSEIRDVFAASSDSDEEAELSVSTALSTAL